MLKRTEMKVRRIFNELYNYTMDRHEKQFHTTPEFKTCEVCGCLVNPTKAVKGDSFVKIEKIIRYISSCQEIKEEIYTPYYCLTHAPKLLKTSNIHELYHELIMEVSSKCPIESRHETALRYIREREKSVGENCAKEG